MNQDTTHNNTNQHNESTLAKIPQLGQISANLKRPTQLSKIRKGKSVNVQLTLRKKVRHVHPGFFRQGTTSSCYALVKIFSSEITVSIFLLNPVTTSNPSSACYVRVFDILLSMVINRYNRSYNRRHRIYETAMLVLQLKHDSIKRPVQNFLEQIEEYSTVMRITMICHAQTYN